MQRQTFIDNMKERGYNITRKPNGNTKATNHRGRERPAPTVRKEENQCV